MTLLTEHQRRGGAVGALAITTLAGSNPLLAAPQWSLLEELVPFLKGHDAPVLGVRDLVDPCCW